MEKVPPELETGSRLVILEATGVMGPTFGFTISLVTLSMTQSYVWSALVSGLARLPPRPESPLANSPSGPCWST